MIPDDIQKVYDRNKVIFDDYKAHYPKDTDLQQLPEWLLFQKFEKLIGITNALETRLDICQNNLDWYEGEGDEL